MSIIGVVTSEQRFKVPVHSHQLWPKRGKSSSFCGKPLNWNELVVGEVQTESSQAIVLSSVADILGC